MAVEFQNLIPDADLLAYCEKELNVLMEAQKKEDLKTVEKKIEFEPYSENQRTFRSPLEVFYLNHKNKQSKFSLHQLLVFWKYLQLKAKQLHFHRQPQLLYIHNQWESVITNPKLVEKEILYPQSFKKKPPTLIKKEPFDVNKLMRCLQDKNKHLISRQTKNASLLCTFENIEDSLIDSKSLDKVVDWITGLYQELNPFIHLVIVHGPVGIGKKTFLKHFLEKTLWLDVVWFSMVDCLSNGLILEDWLRDKIELESVFDQKVKKQQQVFVIYDCEGLDTKGNNMLQKMFKKIMFYNDLIRKNQFKKQILVILVSSDVTSGPLNEFRMSKRKVRTFQLYPAKIQMFHQFYFRIRQRIKEYNDEPLDPRSLPLRIAEDSHLLFLLEQYDVRALLNYISFLWLTMDKMRTFKTTDSNSNSNNRSAENRFQLNCYDITDIVLRKIVPLSLQRLVNNRNEMFKVETLYAIFDMNVPGTKKNNFLAQSYSFMDEKVMKVTPLMILVNAFPYTLGFNSWENYHMSLYGSTSTNATINEIPLKHLIYKVAMYQRYKKILPDAESYLLKELLLNDSLGFRKVGSFKTKYYAGKKESKKQSENQIQQIPCWKRSLPFDKQIELYHMDYLTLNQCYSHIIREFDGNENLDRDITKHKVTQTTKKRKPEKLLTEEKKVTATKKQLTITSMLGKKDSECELPVEKKPVEKVVKKKQKRPRTKKEKNPKPKRQKKSTLMLMQMEDAKETLIPTLDD